MIGFWNSYISGTLVMVAFSIFRTAPSRDEVEIRSFSGKFPEQIHRRSHIRSCSQQPDLTPSYPGSVHTSFFHSLHHQVSLADTQNCEMRTTVSSHDHRRFPAKDFTGDAFIMRKLVLKSQDEKWYTEIRSRTV
jgi:hypothetical protein